MRIFTALPLPQSTKDLLVSITRGRLPISYINTINLHITLNFFGEVSSDRLGGLTQTFSKFCQGQKSFLVEFSRLQMFYHQIHLTVSKNDPIMKFQKELEKNFKNLGFNFQDRSFYPHVKLASVHMDNNMFPKRKIENYPHEELSKLNFLADKVVLYESQLLESHAKHIPIKEESLL